MKIRKTQQPADYPANSIHDSYSTSQTDTYSCNYINEAVKEIYSTDEQVIGKWINGKPIYRKVFTGNMTNTTNNWVNLFKVNQNVDDVITIKGTIKNTKPGSDGAIIDIQAFETSSYRIATRYLNTDYVQVHVAGWTYSAFNFIYRITLEYTKTTD